MIIPRDSPQEELRNDAQNVEQSHCSLDLPSHDLHILIFEVLILKFFKSAAKNYFAAFLSILATIAARVKVRFSESGVG